MPFSKVNLLSCAVLALSFMVPSVAEADLIATFDSPELLAGSSESATESYLSDVFGQTVTINGGFWGIFEGSPLADTAGNGDNWLGVTPEGMEIVFSDGFTEGITFDLMFGQNGDFNASVFDGDNNLLESLMVFGTPFTAGTGELQFNGVATRLVFTDSGLFGVAVDNLVLPMPEPSTFGLLAAALVLACCRRTRRKKLNRLS